MIEAVVVALIAGIALAYVAIPLRSGGRRRGETSHRADEAEARKRNALEAIVDLESEREAGKLSVADFDLLRAEYEAEALAALKELDVIRASQTDDSVENEIAAVRARLVCPSCGAPRIAGEQCPRCGV